MSQPSVKIIQLVTPNIDPFAIYSVASILHYARLHGYKHELLRDQLVTDMHINWTKIEYLRQVISRNQDDFVLLIDADAIITNPSRTVSSLLGNDVHFDIYMPQDTPFFTGFWRPNAGFILVRNSKTGVEIVNKWMNAARNEGKSISNMHPRNQRVYWKYVMPYYSKNQQLLSRRLFKKPILLNPFGNQGYLLHYTSTDDQQRVNKMKLLFQKYVRSDEALRSTEEQLKLHQSGLITLHA